MVSNKYKLNMHLQLLFVSVMFAGAVGQYDIRCPVPMSPKNGQRFLNEGGLTVTFSCDPGYDLVGAQTSTCVDKEWTNGSPICVPEEVRKECYRNTDCYGRFKSCSSDYRCVCMEGFTLNLYDDRKTCVDINECEQGLKCSYECVNTLGSAYCSCPAGYQVDLDGKTCIDVDECTIKNGGCQGQCINTVGSFECRCGDGYRKLDFFSCSDINECDGKDHGCSQNCINFEAGYYCDCNKGYRLGNDQRTCKRITCPFIPKPQNMQNIAYNSLENILKSHSNYPIKTKASFACKKGYKLSLSPAATVTCDETGKWQGDIPECIALKCAPLAIENGYLRPASCMTKPVDIGKKCYFYCNEGYKRYGSRPTVCSLQNNKPTWYQKKQAECKKPLIRPMIKCPEDIVLELATRQNSAMVYIATPETNVDKSRLMVQPDWVQLDSESLFPAGTTDVIFTAFGPKNGTVNCTIAVKILDIEPPKTLRCPDDLIIQSESSIGEVVTWSEPIFEDNLNVASVSTNLDPGTIFSFGLHSIVYTALDEAGNIGTCKFTINVTSPECGYPNSPLHGTLDCNDWSFGRMCQPRCDIGYVLFPQEPSIFTCDDSGTWVPSNSVQNCTRFTYIDSGMCDAGLELQEEIETGKQICVECPENYFWSVNNRMCVPT